MNAEQIQKRLGENLRTMRKKNKLTQFELAEKANVSEDTIKSIELCRAWPSERTLALISEALDIDVFYLFLPTPMSISGDSRIEAEIRQAVTNKYVEYVESVTKNLLLKSE